MPIATRRQAVIGASVSLPRRGGYPALRQGHISQGRLQSGPPAPLESGPSRGLERTFEAMVRLASAMGGYLDSAVTSRPARSAAIS
jgi:hypothetical protein